MCRACWVLLLLSVLLPAGCVPRGPFYGKGYDNQGAVARAAVEEPAYTVYLIGDAGDARSAGPALRLLKKKLESASAPSAVIFLGDNAYCCGLPEAGSTGRADAEQNLDAQLRALEGYEGRIIFLPGNHDWNDGAEGGWAAVRRQEAYVEERLGDRDVFLPSGGCPGPVEVRLRQDLTLLVLGTSWWIYPYEKPTSARDGCSAAEDKAFVQAVDSLLARNAGRRILVAGHHPLYSSGPRGGGLPYSFLAPAEPLYRRVNTDPQDVSTGRYAILRAALLDLFSEHDGLVYAAGHDHSLQYHPVGQQHYLVSGAGARTSNVTKGESTAFAYARRGFLELAYYESGRTRLRAWVPGEDGGRIVFRTEWMQEAARPASQ